MRWSSLMLPMARRIALVPTSIAAIVGMCMVFTCLALSATQGPLLWAAKACREATMNLLEKSRGNPGSPARASMKECMSLFPLECSPEQVPTETWDQPHAATDAGKYDY